MTSIQRFWKPLTLLVIICSITALWFPKNVLAAATTLTFTPTADAYVASSSSTSNYGTLTTLRTDSSPDTLSYLRFNVSGIGTGQVTSATLKLYATKGTSAGFTANALTNNTWSETTLNYGNKPAPGSVIKASGAVTTGAWVSVDITSYIRSDGTYSLVLTPLSDYLLELGSREAGANAPQLVIVLSATSSTATATAPAPATPTAPAIPTATPKNNGKPAPTATPTSRPTATSTSRPTLTPTASSGTGTVPVFSHVFFIVFENTEYSSIAGNSALTNFNGLASQYTLLTKSYAERHPSLPNYIAMTSGDTQGITNDCTTCYLNVTNVADQVEAAGRTWKAYMESMPSACYIGSSGQYVQKHNPFIYYNDIRTNTTRCQQRVVPLTQLDTDLKSGLPNYVFIMPNMCNSGHDCSLSTADKWLGSMVSKIQASPTYDAKSLIVVTFDEGTSSASCCGLPSSAGGQIFTILISPLVKNGYKDATPYSHYSLLKTLEKSWGMPYMGHSADSSATLITAPWK